jgi:hypothetical protein
MALYLRELREVLLTVTQAAENSGIDHKGFYLGRVDADYQAIESAALLPRLLK